MAKTSGLKNLKAVKDTEKSAAEEKKEGAQAGAAPTEEKKKRGSGLIPRTKSPEKQKEEEDLKAAITEALKGKKDGLMASELRALIYEETSEDENKELERKIRAMCRKMDCNVTPVPETRKVRYSLPASK
jgi:hypothetical protein